MEFDSRMPTDIRPFIDASWDEFSNFLGVRIHDGVVVTPFGNTFRFGTHGLFFTGRDGVGKTSTANAVVRAGPDGSRFIREDTPTMLAKSNGLFLCESGNLRDCDRVHGFQEIHDGTAKFTQVSGIFVFSPETIYTSQNTVEPWDSGQYASYHAKLFSRCSSEEEQILSYIVPAVADIPCFLVGGFDSLAHKVKAVLGVVQRICLAG